MDTRQGSVGFTESAGNFYVGEQMKVRLTMSNDSNKLVTKPLPAEFCAHPNKLLSASRVSYVYRIQIRHGTLSGRGVNEISVTDRRDHKGDNS